MIDLAYRIWSWRQPGADIGDAMHVTAFRTTDLVDVDGSQRCQTDFELGNHFAPAGGAHEAKSADVSLPERVKPPIQKVQAAKKLGNVTAQLKWGDGNFSIQFRTDFNPLFADLPLNRRAIKQLCTGTYRRTCTLVFLTVGLEPRMTRRKICHYLGCFQERRIQMADERLQGSSRFALVIPIRWRIKN